MGVNGGRWKGVMVIVGVVGKVKKVKKTGFWEVEKSFDRIRKTMGRVVPSVGDPHSCPAYCLWVALDWRFAGGHMHFASGSRFTFQFLNFFQVYRFKPAPNLHFTGYHLRFIERRRLPPFSSNFLDYSCTWVATRA
ncbi:hypothetical protein HAX54_024200 [Datura stramonium]|uniref:Uncharacterized protein n=1 Tax=Datura stramonium TaxID=4076 RepID=A0ABS8UYA6_DATST|nr:hypothetical protein [Datura stramonium]